MRRTLSSPGFALAAALAIRAAIPSPAAAQPPLELPQPSQAASVSQRIGLTDIEVTYHRPAVNHREIWGHLVPYDQVWRAGANENTVVRFSTSVSVAGKPLPAGAYGLHMIPTASTWTVIFNRESRAWGSFFYDSSEDALRVTVTPKASDFQEHLGYSFDDPSDHGVALILRWEKLAVPIPIEVDTTATVAESLHTQLRNLPGFSWQRLAEAAAWCAAHDTNLPEAAQWADKALGIQKNFTTLRARAAVFEKQGDGAAAGKLRGQAFELASEIDLNNLGYQQLQAGRIDDAVATFRENITRHPESWNVYDSLGEALAMKGDKAGAAANYRKALGMVTDEAQKTRITGILGRM